MADATVTLMGSSVGQIRALNDNPITMAFVDITVGATYATNGNPLVVGDGLDTRKLVGVQLLQNHDGTRHWVWNGSRTAPLLKAYDAFATEEGNGTSTSGVILPAILYFEN